MYNHRYRFAFVLLLTAFCYLITVLCRVYYYFNIQVAWYHAVLTMLCITAVTWEGPRLLEPWLQRQSFVQQSKFRFMALFFMAGSTLSVITAATVVFVIGHFIYHLSLAELYNPIKLNIIYGSLINLLFHLINAIVLYFTEYQKQWMEAEELRRITAQAQVQLMKSQIKPHF